MDAPHQISGPIGIIAGGGSLPAVVARAAHNQGRGVFVVALKGFADSGISTFPGICLRISQASRIIGSLRKSGCRNIVLVGSIKRPASWPLYDVGLSVLWLAIKNLDLLVGGDSSVLSRLVGGLENAGFVVCAPHEIATELVIPEGQLGAVRPDSQAQADIQRGLHSARLLGTLDIGQGVVVARGRVLAAEAAEGTDLMLKRVAEIRPTERKKAVGVLVKCPQPIQDRRVDMPTIGPATVQAAATAGLAGIAIVAGQVLVVEPDRTRQLADDLGLFVEAVAAPEQEPVG